MNLTPAAPLRLDEVQGRAHRWIEDLRLKPHPLPDLARPAPQEAAGELLRPPRRGKSLSMRNRACMEDLTQETQMSDSAMKRDELRMTAVLPAPVPLKHEPVGLPRLVLWKKDLSAMLGVGLRTLERMISAGEIPAPDRRLRGRPAWCAATIHRWAADGCPELKGVAP